MAKRHAEATVFLHMHENPSVHCDTYTEAIPWVSIEVSDTVKIFVNAPEFPAFMDNMTRALGIAQEFFDKEEELRK